MDKRLKAKWVQALRSGEYEQCRSTLLDEEVDHKTYCCLGVLCAVANKEPDAESYSWLDKVTGGYGPFVTMNDDEGKSFSEIADYIEQSL